MEIPFTISSANPEKSRSLNNISAKGSALKYGSIPSIPIVFPLGSIIIITEPKTAPIPINRVQNMRKRLAVLYLDFVFTLTTSKIQFKSKIDKPRGRFVDFGAADRT